MATHSSILAWRIPWTEEPGGLQSMGATKDTTEWLTLSFTFQGEDFLKYIIFLKYKFTYFNWRLITLQYCIGFAIHQHEIYHF